MAVHPHYDDWLIVLQLVTSISACCPEMYCVIVYADKGSVQWLQYSHALHYRVGLYDTHVVR